MPRSPKPVVPRTVVREVDELTPTNRDLIERTLFLGLSRDVCRDHARYSVDRFVLERSGDKTVAHVTQCCDPDDDQIEFIIDLSPDIARRDPDQVIERTTPHRSGATFSMETWVQLGLLRRWRGEAITLEATLILTGPERLNDAQATRLKQLIDEAPFTCPVHLGRSISAVHFSQQADQTLVDLVVCCDQAGSNVMRVQTELVEQALLSGPVVAISAAGFTRRKRRK